MHDAGFTLLFSVLMAPALVRPWLGLLVWVWIDYMNPHRLCYTYAKYRIPFCFISAAVTVGALVISSEKKRFPWTRETVLWLLFILWMNLTTFFALNPIGARIEWDRTMKIQMLIAVTLIVIQNRVRLEGLIWVIVASLAFYGVKGGLFTILSGGVYRVYGPESSFIEDNNDLALALVTTIPLMRYLMLVSERRWVRWGLGSGIALIAVSVLGSYSRGGLLGLAVVLGLMLLKSRRRVVFGLALLVIVPMAIQMMPQQWLDRMNTIRTYQDDGSVQGRFNAWRFALNVAEASPLTGGGFRVFTKPLFRQYAPIPDSYHAAHNIFLKIMAEHGYVGLALFLFMALCSWRSATWIRRHTKHVLELRWASDLAAMAQVALAGYAVGGSFLNLAYFDLPYHLMTIIVLTKLMVREHLSVLAEAPSDSDAAAMELAAGRPAVSFT